MAKRFVVTGATGLIGKKLCAALHDRGDQVVALSRNPEKARDLLPDAVSCLQWSADINDEWSNAVRESDGIINLAGESIGEKRWTDAHKQRILKSRIQGTRIIVNAISSASDAQKQEESKQKRKVLVSVSAVGYYGDTGEREIDESSQSGNDFLARVCVEWEREALQAAVSGVRVVTPRLGIVLSRNGGALERLISPFRLFAGGPIGTGRQWFPWVHIDDVIGIFLHALDNDVSGALLATSPIPIRQKEFAKALGRILHRPSWLPVPAFLLRIVVGEFVDTLLGGQKTYPKRTIETGYKYHYADITKALNDLFEDSA